MIASPERSGGIGMPGAIAFRTPDADTLETGRVGRRPVVFRRVPAGRASYADLLSAPSGCPLSQRGNEALQM